jgi:hypothetical protein
MLVGAVPVVIMTVRCRRRNDRFGRGACRRWRFVFVMTVAMVACAAMGVTVTGSDQLLVVRL